MQQEKLINWVEKLTVQELRATLIALTEKLIETEDVRISDDEDLPDPYWVSCGISIVPDPGEDL